MWSGEELRQKGNFQKRKRLYLLCDFHLSLKLPGNSTEHLNSLVIRIQWAAYILQEVKEIYNFKPSILLSWEAKDERLH